MKGRCFISGWWLVICLFSFGHMELLEAQVSAEEDFDAYISEIEAEFYAFEDSINRDFADYLEQAWQEYTIYEGTEPPLYSGHRQANPFRQKAAIRNKTTHDSGKTFFGHPIQLSSLPGKAMSLSGLSEKVVADGWRKLAAEDFTSFFGSYVGYSQRMCLNDWGNYQLLNWVGRFRYPSFSQQEQTLFLFYTICNAGYKAKLGRIEEDLLVLLLPFTEEVYGHLYIRVEGEKYYIVGEKPGHLKKLYSFANGYPKAKRKISLNVGKPLRFPQEDTARAFLGKYPFSISFNQNLLNYYATFPLCDLSVYFCAKPSDEFAGSIDREIGKKLEGKSQLERIAWLLDFVQQMFTHKPDVEVHGSEIYYFPEETGSYPYADCEDLSVFLSWLVCRFVTTEVLTLYYPEHVAIAVRRCEGYDGEILKFRDKEYILCDPSYKGSVPGKVIPACSSLKPVIISYFK